MSDQDVFPVFDSNQAATRSVSFKILKDAVPNLVSAVYIIPNLILTQSDGTTITVNIDEGTIPPFKSAAARDAFFTTGNNLTLLEEGLPIVVNDEDVQQDTNIVTIQVWTGVDSPTSYDGNLFIESALNSGPGTLFLGKDGANFSSAGREINVTSAYGDRSISIGTRFSPGGSQKPFEFQFNKELTGDVANVFDQTLVGASFSFQFTTTIFAYTEALSYRPASTGVLRLRIYAGTDDTFPIIADTRVTIVSGDIGNQINVPFNGILSHNNDNFVIIVEGIDFFGGLQTSGPFSGQTLPFFGSTFHTLTPIHLLNKSDLDQYALLNSDYTTNAARSGGVVVNSFPTTTVDTFTNSTFVAGVAAVSNPTMTTVGSNIFSAGDFILVNHAGEVIDSDLNDGPYEVLSHVGTTLTIKGVGLTATVEDFVRDNFIFQESTGTITKTKLSVLKITDTQILAGFGSSSPVTFTDIGVGGPGGVNTDIQFNNSGVFGGSPNFTFDGSDVQLSDNTSLVLGTGDDLIAVHDSTNTTITSKTGNLVIDNTNATGDTNLILGSDTSATKLNISANTAGEILTVSGDRNVGIGTSTPSNRLHVQGTSSGSAEVLITSDTDATNQVATLAFSIPAGLPRSGMFGITRGANTMDLTLFAQNTSTEFDAITILGLTGFVGIGDTSPDNRLDVHSATTESAIAITSLGTNTDALIKFEVTTDNVANFSIGVDDSDGDKFKISTTALGTDDRVVIDSAGLVGIGTSTPAKRLHIEGTSGGSAEVLISTDTDADGERSTLAFSIPAGEPRSGMFGTSRISNTMDLALFARGPAGEFDAITILGGTGFVGIGNTTPDNKLDVRNTSGESAIAITALVGDSLIKFELADTVATFSMGVDQSDSDKFKIGTTALAASTRMTIDSSGNVGIGTTSPSSLLEVDGVVTLTANSGNNLFLGSMNDAASEGGRAIFDGGGSNDTWLVDSFFQDLRIFPTSTNVGFVRIFNASSGSTGLKVQGSTILGDEVSAPLATLDVRGTLNFKRTGTAASVTTTTNEIIIGVTDTSAARTITLQTADAIEGRMYFIKDESGAAGMNNITINTQGGQTIDGDATLVIASNYGGATLYSDGSNWFVIGKT